MERSLAIKSPSIQYHLAGTKKVQQALATPGSVERFIDNVDMVEEIKSVFAGIYSLDHDDEGTICHQLRKLNLGYSLFILRR